VRFKHSARATVAAAVLALVAAGCGGGSDTGGSGADGINLASCKIQLGFFGALTGDNANLGINIQQGAQLAIEQYNAKHKDNCVGLKKYDSAGVPEQAPPLARAAVGDKTVLGIIGPAFSGESNVANPTFDKGGLPIITASATNPILGQKGFKTFHRILGNDAIQGAAVAKYIKDTMKAQKVFVVDDATDYGKGLATIVKGDLGATVVGTDTVQQKQTDFSATVTKIRASGATAFYYGGYYAEAGKLRKQLTDAGGKAITMVASDGVRDPGFVKGAGQAAAEGTILTCPCLPGSKTTGTFAADYEKRWDVESGTYSPEAYDAANVFLQGIEAGKTTRAALNAFIGSYSGDGVTKKIQFDAKGEVTEKVIWAYSVKAGNIVENQEIKQ
jgi:branched-chain amino acid transport system substrate-binding protein